MIFLSSLGYAISPRWECRLRLCRDRIESLMSWTFSIRLIHQVRFLAPSLVDRCHHHFTSKPCTRDYDIKQSLTLAQRLWDAPLSGSSCPRDLPSLRKPSLVREAEARTPWRIQGSERSSCRVPRLVRQTATTETVSRFCFILRRGWTYATVSMFLSTFQGHTTSVAESCPFLICIL